VQARPASSFKIRCQLRLVKSIRRSKSLEFVGVTSNVGICPPTVYRRRRAFGATMAQRDCTTSRHDTTILDGLGPNNHESRVTSWLQQIQQANKLPSEEPPAIRGCRQPPVKPSNRAAFLSTSDQYVREDDDQTLLSCPRVALGYVRVPRDSTAPSSHDHAFSKRKRHKTRTDRYDVGGGRRHETSKRHRSFESRRKGHSTKHLRTGQEIIENFTPRAIAHEKITVCPCFF
jgi:hypothetical protein